LWCHVARAVFDQRGNEWMITNPKGMLSCA